MNVQQALVQAFATAAADAIAQAEVRSQDISDDIVHGASGIAKFLFGSDEPTYRRRVYHLSDPRRKDRLPVFRMGNQIFARKSTLLKLIEQREVA
jgi:hypothetical protein